jgi:hypothetical protein
VIFQRDLSHAASGGSWNIFWGVPELYELYIKLCEGDIITVKWSSGLFRLIAE